MNEKKKAQYNDDFILLTYIALLRCAFFEVRHVLWGYTLVLYSGFEPFFVHK